MKKSLVSLSLGGLSIGTTEFVMMGLLPDVARDFNITIPEAGHFISAYALGVVIGAPLLVALGGSFPPKKILITLMAMFTVFNLASAFATGSTALLLTRLLSGLPHGAFFGVGSVMATRLADRGKEAQAIAVMFAGLTIANLLMVPLGTYIGHHFTWRYTFAMIGVIGFITILSILFWMPALESSRSGSVGKELGFFRKKEAWLLVAITSIGTGGLFAWISYIAPMMISVTGFPADKVPYILILAGFGMFTGNFIGGKLADSYPPARACIISLFAIVACLIVDYMVASSQSLTLLMVFVTGAITFTLGTPIQILMIKTAQGAEMLGASVSQAAFNIGNALGAFLGGLPIAAGLGLASPLLVGVVMAMAGVGFTWQLIRTQKLKRSV